MFKKFFGKKNDGFYLQIEDDTPKTEPAVKAKPQDVVAPAPATSTTAAVVATPATPVSTSANIDAAKIDKKAVKALEKEAKMAKKAGLKAEAPKPETTVTPPAAKVSTEPPITNFATDYLIKPSSISGRRRPGANMNGFLALARQVEKPKNFKATALERKAEK